jgi:hypothetical protein
MVKQQEALEPFQMIVMAQLNTTEIDASSNSLRRTSNLLIS